MPKLLKRLRIWNNKRKNNNKGKKGNDSPKKDILSVSDKSKKSENEFKAAAGIPNDDVGYWWVWFGVDLKYQVLSTLDYIMGPEWSTKNLNPIDEGIREKQREESQYLSKLTRFKLNRRRSLRKKYNSDITYFSRKKEICNIWSDNTKLFLNQKFSQEENSLPSFNYQTKEFDEKVEFLIDRIARVTELCDDLNCFSTHTQASETSKTNNLLELDSSISIKDDLNKFKNFDNEIKNDRSNWEKKFIQLRTECSKNLEDERGLSLKIKQKYDNEFKNIKRNFNELQNDRIDCVEDLANQRISYQESQVKLEHLKIEYNNLNEKYNQIQNQFEQCNSKEQNINLNLNTSILNNFQKIFEALILLPIKIINGDVYPEMKAKRWGFNSISITIIRLFLALFIIYLYFCITSTLINSIETLFHNLKKPDVTKNIVITNDSGKNSKNSKKNSFNEDEEWKKYKLNKSKKNKGFNTILQRIKNLRGGFVSPEIFSGVDVSNLRYYERQILLTSISPELYLVKFIKKKQELEFVINNIESKSLKNLVKIQLNSFKKLIQNPQLKATILGTIIFIVSANNRVTSMRTNFYNFEQHKIINNLFLEQDSISESELQINNEITKLSLNENDNSTPCETSKISKKVSSRNKKFKWNRRVHRLSDLPLIEKNHFGEEIKESKTIIYYPNSQIKIRVK